MRPKIRNFPNTIQWKLLLCLRILSSGGPLGSWILQMGIRTALKEHWRRLNIKLVTHGTYAETYLTKSREMLSTEQLFDVLRNCSEGLHQLLREEEKGSDYFYEMNGGTNKYGKIYIPDNELCEMRCKGFTVREIARFFRPVGSHWTSKSKKCEASPNTDKSAVSTKI
ncbi:uncharacterized protein LOC129602111 isoform X2 [Paramacrobiotus metropolitanus]|uniref:uncharacterized protein LOC129602111 isoform X2 n=1 Tax=Paramacrobiotus metropolitanus TaxID=2943436 RepID=UPI0024464AE8|nr:uncharacterized protein LOC129602111 isoform X2 [Paramacrobiotus metropolitanus]